MIFCMFFCVANLTIFHKLIEYSVANSTQHLNDFIGRPRREFYSNLETVDPRRMLAETFEWLYRRPRRGNFLNLKSLDPRRMLAQIFEWLYREDPREIFKNLETVDPRRILAETYEWIYRRPRRGNFLNLKSLDPMGNACSNIWMTL